MYVICDMSHVSYVNKFPVLSSGFSCGPWSEFLPFSTKWSGLKFEGEFRHL